MKLDPVLGRQLRRTLELPNDGALGAWLDALLDGDRASRAQQVDALRTLLRLVDDSYVQHRRDAALRTRSLMLSSEELIVANERLRAEMRAQQLACEAQAAAEASSRAKGEFLASMSHEIRTPMNCILGLVDLALAGELSGPQRRYLTLARSSAGSLLSIIDDILDVSRMEAGRLKVEELPFELEPLLRDALEPLEPRAREKGVALTLELDGALPAEGLGDPMRLRQVLVNLVGNAVKFTREGSIRVRAQPRRTAGERRLHLSVIDTGIGIPADKLEHIFESFTQADASVSREFGGSGLGLTISRRLCALMGGRLWAESEPGLGSAFHVELPWKRAPHPQLAGRLASPLAIAERMATRATGDPTQAADEELELPPDPPCGPGVLEVLLVDDHALNQFLTTTLVRRMGHRVTCATTGDAVLQLLEHRGFDLLLLDVQLPGMGGLEVAQHIRARERTKGGHVPIVALSAHAMPADRERSLAAGMDDHLAKPVDRERLGAVLQLLKRSQLRHSVTPR
jgi:signal transduction histidine kinase/ActR/RegA family two-component response regulator